MSMLAGRRSTAGVRTARFVRRSQPRFLHREMLPALLSRSPRPGRNSPRKVCRRGKIIPTKEEQQTRADVWWGATSGYRSGQEKNAAGTVYQEPGAGAIPAPAP